MFPLPNVFLLPGTIMPLHIFEPRYRQMIEDSLDGPGRLVIASVLEGHHDDLEGAPPVHHIAGLGEIWRHERLPQGRFLIWLAGLTRVLIREVPSDKPYRQVEAQPLLEISPSGGDDALLREQVKEAVLARTPEALNLPENIPLGHLVDLLLLKLSLPQGCMQKLYSELRITDRARLALEEHHRRPIPPSAPPTTPAEPGMN
jgi:Lon protease-like protein